LCLLHRLNIEEAILQQLKYVDLNLLPF